MKKVSVRELKNKTSEVLRNASRREIVITPRGRPVACLVGVDEEGRPTVSRTGRSEAWLTPREKERMFRLAARVWRIKPDRRKKWVSQEYHDRVLYGD